MTPIDAGLIRAADIVLSFLALVVLAIPMLVLGLMIRAEDGGAALFRQVRVGRNGKPFEILKFRSMTHDPARALGLVEAGGLDDMRQARARFQTTDPVADPRVTRMGRVLRASHLDELPQLINVIRGEMSIVGVRPDTPVQQVDYSPEYWQVRHTLRPGITGPAQLRSDTASLNERSELELTWIRNPRMLAYLRVLFATVFKVLKRTGN